MSPNATRDNLLVYYKHAVHPDLPFSPPKTFTKTPRVLPASALFNLTIEELRFAIFHCHARHVFCHHSLLDQADYVAIYELFLLEDESACGKLIEDYHYSLILDKIKTSKK